MEKVNKEKVTDKALSRLILTSVFGVLLCLGCLCSVTWAWFSKGITSGNTTIETAQCTLQVKATDDEGLTVFKNGEENVESIGLGDTMTVTLEKGTYKVTLSIEANSTSGYCVLIANGTEYYTDYLVGGNEEARSLTFTLKVTAETEVIKFIPHWGIYAMEMDDSVGSGGTLTLPASASNVNE